MKRVFKRKEESPKEFTARNLINSLDKQVDELEKNNIEIDTLFGLLKGKLTPEQEENLHKVLSKALELSSNIVKSL